MKVKSILTNPVAPFCYKSVKLVREEDGEPLTRQQVVDHIAEQAKKHGLRLAGLSKRGKTIVLEIKDNKVSTDWWTPETREIFCSICDKKDTKDCDKISCQVHNPYCG